jgi:hypothetical protein
MTLCERHEGECLNLRLLINTHEDISQRYILNILPLSKRGCIFSFVKHMNTFYSPRKEKFPRGNSNNEFHPHFHLCTDGFIPQFVYILNYLVWVALKMFKRTPNSDTYQKISYAKLLI